MLKRTIASGMVCFVFLGCGGDDDDTTAGVSKSRRMNTLSATELKNLCYANQDRYDSIARGGCMLTERGAGASEADCEAACADAESAIDCEGANPDDVKTCDFTVAAAESCLANMVAAVSGVSCSSTEAPSFPECVGEAPEGCPIFGGS